MPTSTLRHRLSRFGGAVVVFAALLSDATSAGAAEVVPGFLVHELVPGRVDVIKLTLRTRLATERVLLHMVDFSIDRRGGILLEEPKDRRYSAKAWARFRPTEMILQKGRDYVIEIPMLAPGGTPGGEYYAGLEIITPPKDPPGAKGLNTQVEVGLIALMIIKIKGGLPKVAGELLESAVEMKDYVPQFKTLFHSLCTVAVVARAGVIVRGENGKIFDQVILQGAGSKERDGQAFMLPDAYRDFTGQGNRKLPAGKYVAGFVSYFGKKKIRALAQVAFEIKESPVTLPPPLDDIIAAPAKLVLEMPAGGVKYPVLEFKNRGFNAVDVKLESDPPGVSFFPDVLKLEPGRSSKVRVGIRVPAAENPQRVIQIRLVLEGGTEKDRKSVPIAVYAPGTAPKEDPQNLNSEKARSAAVPTDQDVPEEGEPAPPEKKP